MKKVFVSIVLLFCAIIFVQSCKKDSDSVPKKEPITSNSFKQDAAGWTISGDAQGGYVAASYSPDGGVTNGYIYANDNVMGGVWYYKAPKSYLGNKNNYYNAIIKFSLFQLSAMQDQFDDASDIIFESDNKRIVHQLPKHPDSTWTDYNIKINAQAGWLNGDYDSDDTATQSEIEAVLSDVTGFYIRGEFESGADKGGMDNIEIVKP